IVTGSDLNLSPLFSSNGLVGYWKFDEGQGTSTQDSSGNGNTGTLSASPPGWVSGKVGDALSFNGTNYVSVPDSASDDPISAWTLSALVKRSSTGIQHDIIEKYDWTAGNGNFAMRILSSDKLIAYLINGTVSASCGNTVTSIGSGNWYHVAATYDSSISTLKCYVNGSVEATNAAVSIVPLNSTVTLKIGCQGNDCSNKFNGLIDDVRIYNRALSAAEIMALYNATK
ncbi:MAG TPA: LamG domain-containing protein, partial [Candidatus Paceibacterota bacterium]|nr:LamG domain-containing protein [Candidatus Paceibacterota bacterium]